MILLKGQPDSLMNNPPPPFKQARVVELWCAEPVFFASRELSDCYYTEGVIGNYALAYAFGWVRSPYRLQGQATGRPTYREDLEPLAQACYVLPAMPINGRVTFRFERFNALSDSYWYAMTNNRVATAREDVPLQRQGKKPNSFRPSNFPQTGRLRMIERGNKFRTVVFGNYELPDYIRLGKFLSKVQVNIVAELEVAMLAPAEYQSQAYLNTADLPPNLEIFSFDLISIPPAPLVKNLRFRGAAWRVGEMVVPDGIHFCCGGTYNDQ